MTLELVPFQRAELIATLEAYTDEQAEVHCSGGLPFTQIGSYRLFKADGEFEFTLYCVGKQHESVILDPFSRSVTIVGYQFTNVYHK